MLHALASKQVQTIKSTRKPTTGPVKGGWLPSLFDLPGVHEVSPRFGDADTEADYCTFNTSRQNSVIFCSFYFDNEERALERFLELAECGKTFSWKEVTEIEGGLALKTDESLFNLTGEYRMATKATERKPKWHVDFSYSKRSQ
jgi:hypothetical protein